MRYGTLNPDYGGRLASTAPQNDGPIWMVNFMRYRPVADYPDGRESTISGREADDLYAPLDVLAEIGAEVAFAGDVVGGAGERWDRIGIVRYRTRRSFTEMPRRPDFQARHIHKDAGMEFTIILGALPQAGSPGLAHGAPVRLIAYQPGHAAPPLDKLTCRFTVEGVIIGDQRRFETLDMIWSAGEPGSAASPDSLDVLIEPFLDRVNELFDPR
jgi:hypothetical protein